MFDRISNSFALARSSWQVLRTDKQLIVFPIISGIACLLILLSFALPFVVHPQWLDFMNHNNPQGRQVPPWVYIVAFAYYFCNYFVIVFCNAALISCALVRFNGGTPTLADGFSAAMNRLPQIVAWALVSATVGLLLKMIENANEKAGQFISAIIGTAWTVLTYFVVPVLVVERVGPIDAVKRSMSILRKTWGEALVGHFGIGFFVFLLALPGVLLLFVAVALGMVNPVAGVALGVLAVLYLALASAASSALHGIYLGALYQFAAYKQVPDGFDRDVMEGAFKRKKS
ncbi:MAG TPA: DUF6159 family protein [Gemmataceae bacterium]|jgi:hypothetical protein|nr:DUF6159 family protein [Gemmataceae bacterium]